MLKRLKDENLVTNRSIAENFELQDVFHDAVERVLLDYRRRFGAKGAGILLCLATNFSTAGMVKQQGIDQTFANERKKARREARQADVDPVTGKKPVGVSEMKRHYLEAKAGIDDEIIDHIADRLTETGAFPRDGPPLPDDLN
eukprot:4390958-Pyramimonas_sp.AAC.1